MRRRGGDALLARGPLPQLCLSVPPLSHSICRFHACVSCFFRIRSLCDWRALFPYQPADLDLGGVTMRYIDTGAGKPVLMVHGNPTWSFYWHELIRDLQPDYRCVAPDHIGCGYSDKPQRYPYTLDQHIQNLIRLIERLDLQRITLVAHDWGGAIGLGALVRLKERFEKIVLLNTAAFPPPYFPLRIRLCRFPLLGQWAVQGLNLFARSATVMATERRGGLRQPSRRACSRPTIPGPIGLRPINSSRHPDVGAPADLAAPGGD